MTESAYWKFENTGFHTGVFNMEYDITLAQAMMHDGGFPTLRVYGWQPHAISLGWNQSLEEVNAERAAADGIDVVRRPTGGRAILHANELTYSVVMRVKQKRIATVYEEIGQALIAGLTLLGLSAAMEKSQPHFPSLYKSSSAAACFSSAGRYEIKCNNKKIVGSAQRRYSMSNGEEIVLQHGSILIDAKHKQIVDYLRLSAENDRTILALELEEKTTELSTELHRAVTFNEVADAVQKGFELAWDIKFINKQTNQEVPV